MAGMAKRGGKLGTAASSSDATSRAGRKTKAKRPVAPAPHKSAARPKVRKTARKPMSPAASRTPVQKTSVPVKQSAAPVKKNPALLKPSGGGSKNVVKKDKPKKTPEATDAAKILIALHASGRAEALDLLVPLRSEPPALGTGSIQPQSVPVAESVFDMTAIEVFVERNKTPAVAPVETPRQVLAPAPEPASRPEPSGAKEITKAVEEMLARAEQGTLIDPHGPVDTGQTTARPDAPPPAPRHDPVDPVVSDTPALLERSSSTQPGAGTTVDPWLPSPAEIPYASELHAAPSGAASSNEPASTMKASSPNVTPSPNVPHNPAKPSAGAPGASAQSTLPLLFEVAWEVCWQLGGIYTVLKSKATCMQQRWGDRYFLIGPYNPTTAAVEFEEQATEGVIRLALDKLRQQGINCHYGRWLIPGRPRVILLDHRGRYGKLADDKYLLWKDHGISTPGNDGEANDVIAFGFSVAEFFRALTQVAPQRNVLAHFHEWMGGVAVPRIAHERIPVATVFTTHATLLGRYLASDSPNFYDHLPYINADEQATKYNIYARFAIERAASHSATVFTTVSEVTAREAKYLLGREPDLILPNGLNIQRFAALHEFQNLHREYKERIHEFVMGHFFPAYTFDLDKTIYVFTSGRYEYRNKGMDLFIEAMHRLNWRLRDMPAVDRPTVVAFIITRAPNRHVNVGVLQNRSMFEDLKGWCGQLEHRMGQRLFATAAHGRTPSIQDLLDEDSMVRLKQSIHAWRNGRQPAIVTHDLVDDANDPVLKHLRHRQMFNGEGDAVKMIFHPEFVSATSPLFNLDYEQFVRGCHMGIFPSYYEPWGYTPMESIAMGVPAVTTDLSGFGAYVERHVADNEQQGVYVLNRRTKHFEQTTEDLVNQLLHFVTLNRRQRIELRNRTERLSELFDWGVLVSHYHKAHDLALERVGKKGKVEVRMV